MDIRARPFVGKMKGRDSRDSESRPVLRHEYYCNQSCVSNIEGYDDVEDDVDVDDEESDDDSDSDVEEDIEAAHSKPSKRRRFKYSTAACKVKLLVSGVRFFFQDISS